VITEHDALATLQRDLEAERRHINPEQMRRERALTKPAPSEVIAELCDAVLGPSRRRRTA
jgi:hypothetical protein